MADVFAVQDEITSLIVSTLASARGVVATRASSQLAANKAPEDMAAYELVLRFRALEAGAWTKENFLSAKGLLERAIALDPNYARAHSELARWAMFGWVLGWDPSAQPPATIREAAVNAVGLAPLDPMANLAAAWGHFFDHRFDRFETFARRAVELGPYDALVLAEAGMMTAVSGEWDRGVALVTRARELNRRSAGGWYHIVLSFDRYLKGEYEDSLAMVRRHAAQDANLTIMAHVFALGQLGALDKAIDFDRRLATRGQVWKLGDYHRALSLWSFREQDIAAFLDGARKAGVPES